MEHIKPLNINQMCIRDRYSGVAREVLEALLDKYMDNGVYDIENTSRATPLYLLKKSRFLTDVYKRQVIYN